MVIIIFILGLFIGSFLNVCISRIPLEESIAYPPSHCTSCSAHLKPWDLVPLLSYIYLGGRCRYCKTKISVEYPLAEIITGLIFAVLYIKFGFSFYLFKYLIFTALAVVIAAIDYKYQLIYQSTTIAAFTAGIAIIILEKIIYSQNVTNYFFGALSAALIISIIVYVTKGMGTGDIEIAAYAGLFLGFPLSLLMIALSFVIGGGIAVILLLLKIRDKKDPIAFGPYLLLSAFLCILWGKDFLLWYFLLF
ncbi:prepilin peptidase [Clostridium polynesiense]|uniref:prepilin peptidase n=1 Tax=Clostridium polynesiense TaxID=1325933 RepID=UPI000590293D|nr:A24 family peptidase [Clostridium polynesiense]